jgi:hypothetical protein
MEKKRDSDRDETMSLVLKKQKTESEQGAIVAQQTPPPHVGLDSSKKQLIQSVPRTSGLLSPIMLLTGHKVTIMKDCR